MKTKLVSSLLVISLYWLCLCNHVFVVSSLCLDDQRSLLLQFKNSLTFSNGMSSGNSSRLNSWNARNDCCRWMGVTCDKEGHVTALDLSGESISGGFHSSSSLFSLRYLRNLNFYNNRFNSVIPSSFNKLENLTYLNLSQAGFGGQIPMEISQLSRLVTLDLSSWYQLEIRNLGKLVQNLTKLRQLYLDGVSISAHGQEWHAALLQIPTLQELSMVDCDLSGPLHSSLTRLENLRVINLGDNNLSSAVPENFANFRNLKSLNLDRCELIGMFPQKIFQMPTLSFIDISGNINLDGFFPEFPLNGSLQTLLVSNTNFSAQLPNSIGNLRNLSVLDLSSSQFSGLLPNSLSSLSQLVHLDLSWNNFTGTIPSLRKCRKLQSISLSDNSFIGGISSAIEDLPNLNFISLENNFFSGIIPSSIFTLPSLNGVILYNNEFEGQLNEFINASSSIQSLDLSRNHLEGPIPISLFQLTNLDDLTLSFNNFSGTIELSMLSKLRNLTTLDISYNNLTIIDTSTPQTPFPLFPSLSVVNLASCKLTTFPQFFKNHSPEHIDLSNNHIVGTIPRWIWENGFLDHMNLSYNYLTDWEEPLLNNLSSLSLLDFHSNNLQGNIPESICNAPNLDVLDLSNNALTGTIPKCLIAMNGTLSVLDLGWNKLNGTIHTFPGLCSLRTLHLNGNSLQGKLPKYLANCAMMEILDIGENQIHDQFPCWLKNISTLRILILRSNILHGSLKCGGTKLEWPQLQIFDLANNSFDGGIPLSFFANWKAMVAVESDGNLSKPGYLLGLRILTGQFYYEDRVTVTSKQQQMKLVKILTIFTAIDLSCNKFVGQIPEGLGQLNALYILNLSHNTFSGPIPSSFGNLKDLESFDLANNNLSGKIPTQIAELSFLSFMNLSCNHLVGRIPTGTQIQSFPADSFKGNDGLCGPPLSQNCSGDGMQRPTPLASNIKADTKNSIEWNFISVEVGFTFGIGIIVLPVLLYKPWRTRYWKCVDDILYYTFPQLDFVYERHGGQSFRTLRWKSCSR